MSWKEAAPAGGEDTSSRRSIAHFCPHKGCNGHDPQHFRSNKSVVKETTFLEEAGTFSYRTMARGEAEIPSCYFPGIQPVCKQNG